MAMQDTNELERILAARAREKAELQRRNRTIAQAVDGQGLVSVLDLTTRSYRRLWPVDAAEAIRAGAAVLKGHEPVAPPPEPEPVVEPDPAPAPAPVKPARKGKAPAAPEAPEV